ncbi:unnamed protein product [Larinioides sclopetarius]|uniref:Uncharacterized protein n=1 Tax=Larinioides sclopetarius TaxID=280406 RepID=A0AAV2B7A0_9ARAC
MEKFWKMPNTFMQKSTMKIRRCHGPKSPITSKSCMSSREMSNLFHNRFLSNYEHKKTTPAGFA